MTDLSYVLPTFPLHPYTRLIPSLEKHKISTTDLLTLNAAEISKRAHLPLLEVRRLCRDVLGALQHDLGVGSAEEKDGDSLCLDSSPMLEKRVDDGTKAEGSEQMGARALRMTGVELVEKRWETISTLDESLDAALGGGVPVGYITEVTGESGAGKTQFLLSLLLGAQLPAPHGVSRSAIYISTESSLPTTRLAQMLRDNSQLQGEEGVPKPSLDRIVGIMTPDLESQDHILRFQLPVAIQRFNVGLVVIDSITANFRAEFDREGPNGTPAQIGKKNGINMAKRTHELIKLGDHLRHLARTYNLAIVVSNQVSDRFTFSSSSQPTASLPSLTSHHHNHHNHHTQSSPLAHRSNAPIPPMPTHPQINLPSSQPPDGTPRYLRTAGFDPLTLDYQQRYFTGWGDGLFPGSGRNLKTPGLGLVWTEQIACRIALLKTPVYKRVKLGGGMGGASNASVFAAAEAAMGLKSENEVGTVNWKLLRGDEEDRDMEKRLVKWRRWFKVVFAAWVGATGPRNGEGQAEEGAVEFDIMGYGLKGVGGVRAEA